jgi:hypothetical protein
VLIVGCDYHPGFQQIAFVDMETGELQERRLAHRDRRAFSNETLPVEDGRMEIRAQATCAE